MVVGWHSIALVVHWHSVGSGVAKDSYNQILDFSPQWHFIDPQLIKEWKSKCWEWFFPVTGNLIFSSGRGLAQWHSSDRLATLCHWNQCPHFGQSCATQKLHPYYKTTAVADRQPKKVDHFTQNYEKEDYRGHSGSFSSRNTLDMITLACLYTLSQMTMRETSIFLKMFKSSH